MYVCLDSKRLSVISIPSRTIHVQNTKKNCNKICEGKLGIASRTELKTEAVSSLRRSALGNAHHTQRQRCNVLLPGYAQKDVRDRQFGPSCLVSSSSSSSMTFQWQVPCIQFILGTPESVAPRSLVPSCKNCHHHTRRAPTANWSIIITWLEFFLFHSLSWYWIDTGGHPNSEILCWRGKKNKTCRCLNAQILSWSKISIEEKNESSMKSRKGCH